MIINKQCLVGLVAGQQFMHKPFGRLHTALPFGKDHQSFRSGHILLLRDFRRQNRHLGHARGIEQLDETGHRVASVTDRAVRSELPLIAGEGADKAAREAVQIFAAAGPLLPRVRGLQRVGERRWDVVLDRGQRILLPAEGPVAALERAIALNQADDMLGRDISVVDLRDGTRPVARVGINAQNEIRAIQGRPLLGPDGREIPKDDKKS